MGDMSNKKDESEWDYTDADIAIHFPFFDVLNDGRIHVLSPPLQIVPLSDNYIAGVRIKDVVVSANVSVRIFLPSASANNDTASDAVARKEKRQPLLFYMHGSGYCMESPFSVDYTRYVGRLADEANAVAVSVKYGLFPEHPIPACYEDCMTALLWVASHAGPAPTVGDHDPWIKDYADLRRIFVAGDSAGGNISHYLVSRVRSTALLRDVKVEGMFMVHPHFGEDDKMWMYMCPTNTGPTDPRLKPAVEDLARIGCGRVLVVVAEKDDLRDAGKAYVEELTKSGWKGIVELLENKGKDHCFHIYHPEDPEARVIQQRIISFINNHP